MEQLKIIQALASFFMRSLLKQKASYLLIILVVIMLVLAYLSSDINIGATYKLFEDLLLSSQMFVLHVMALFYAFEFLQKERLNGLFILPLSTSLNRRSYLLAVFLAQLELIGVLGILFISIDIIALWLVEGTFVWIVIVQLFLYMLSAILLSFLVLTISQYVSIMNSMIYAVTLFIIGGGLDELYVYVFYMHPELELQTLTTLLYYGFINFSLFDMQSIVVNRSVFEMHKIVEPIIYFLILALIIFALGSLKFSKRVLKTGE
jgi:hypothetical protein